MVSRHGNNVIGISKEIREALKGAADFILPFRCVICGNVSDSEDRFENYGALYRQLYGREPELHICGKCLSELVCTDEQGRWLLCLSNPIENDPCPGLALYLLYPYKGIIEHAVPRIKFGKQIELARFFGCVLGSFLQSENIKADIMVPVPLSQERFKERGFNQASEIAFPVSRLNNIRFADDCLIRIRDTQRQSEITDKNLRANNVSGAFGVSDNWDLTGMTVIVVDDVATTGATLHEAAAALYRAGATKVLCIALSGNRYAKNTEPY